MCGGQNNVRRLGEAEEAASGDTLLQGLSLSALGCSPSFAGEVGYHLARWILFYFIFIPPFKLFYLRFICRADQVKVYTNQTKTRWVRDCAHHICGGQGRGWYFK